MNYKKLDEELQLIPFCFLESFEELFRKNMDLCNKFLHDCFEEDYDLDRSCIRRPGRMSGYHNTVFFALTFATSDMEEEINDPDRIFRVEVFSEKINNKKGKIIRAYLDSDAWGGSVSVTRRFPVKEDEVLITLQAISLGECNVMYENGDRDRDIIWFSLLVSRTFQELYEKASLLLDDDELDRLMSTAIKISKNEDIKSNYIKYLTS